MCPGGCARRRAGVAPHTERSDLAASAQTTQFHCTCPALEPWSALKQWRAKQVCQPVVFRGEGLAHHAMAGIRMTRFSRWVIRGREQADEGCGKWNG
jgi:hypothetical protein